MGIAVFEGNSAFARRARLSGCILSLTLLAGVSVRAQDADPRDASSGQPTATRELDEEVIVTGQRTLRSLINEAGVETENFYSRLNVVLDKPEFEVHCQNEYPPGSNISQRVCRTRYQEELESRAALSAIQGFGTTDDGQMVFSGSSFDQQPVAMQIQQEFAREVVEAVNTDPELNRSAVRLLQLKAAVENYQSARRQRREAERAAEEASGSDD
jgi:hypothetical protein